jgi:hypothetical protein
MAEVILNFEIDTDNRLFLGMQGIGDRGDSVPKRLSGHGGLATRGRGDRDAADARLSRTPGQPPENHDAVVHELGRCW